MKSIYFKSNITIEHNKSLIEEALKSIIYFSDYDNMINDTQMVEEINPDYIIFFDFLDNIIEDFEFEILGNSKNFAAVTSIYLQKIKLFTDAIDTKTTIFFCHLFPFISLQNRTPNIDKILAEVKNLNQQIVSILSSRFKNFEEIDTQSITVRLGLPNVLNLKFYANNKAAYSEDFIKEVCAEIVIKTRNFSREFKKVIILDCDNTLWKGIVGEDGCDGIGIHPSDYPGNIFYKVQKDIKRMKEEGAILAIASKNNFQDVKEVFDKNNNMVLHWEDFSAVAINWDPKPDNLNMIAKDLNLGSDSFVFIDDSDVEIQQMQDCLPGVTTYQVPKRLSNYRAELGQFFYRHFSKSLSGIDKTQEYKMRRLAENLKQQIKTFDEFVAALEISLVVSEINTSSFERCLNLLNKTNQFNLNGYKMSEAELLEFCKQENSKVYTCAVSDKFGDSGLTALVLVDKDDKLIRVNHMAASCRILGRGIEEVFLHYVLSLRNLQHIDKVKFSYVKTEKNQITRNFLQKITGSNKDLSVPILKEDLQFNKRIMDISYE